MRQVCHSQIAEHSSETAQPDFINERVVVIMSYCVFRDKRNGCEELSKARCTELAVRLTRALASTLPDLPAGCAMVSHVVLTRVFSSLATDGLNVGCDLVHLGAQNLLTLMPAAL